MVTVILWCIHYRGVSAPRCIHLKGVSTPRSIISGVSISGVSLIRLPGVSTTGESPRCIPHRGVETPLCVHHRGVVSTVFSCFNGLPWPLKEESLKSNYG
jgi:hypothetical protein